MADESPPRWPAALAAIEEFRRHLATHVPPLTMLSATDAWWDDEEYRRNRPPGFPGRMLGVYLMYDADGALLYVGSAVVSYDKRVWSHDGLFVARGRERRWIDVITLPAEYAFLAPSLECFLIGRLRPACNTAFVGYAWPELDTLPAASSLRPKVPSDPAAVPDL